MKETQPLGFCQHYRVHVPYPWSSCFVTSCFILVCSWFLCFRLTFASCVFLPAVSTSPSVCICVLISSLSGRCMLHHWFLLLWALYLSLEMCVRQCCYNVKRKQNWCNPKGKPQSTGNAGLRCSQLAFIIPAFPTKELKHLKIENSQRPSQKKLFGTGSKDLARFSNSSLHLKPPVLCP